MSRLPIRTSDLSNLPARLRIAGKVWLSFGVLIVGYVLSVAIVFGIGLQAERRLARLSDSTFTAAQLSQAAVAAFDVQTKTYETAVLNGDLALIDAADEQFRTVEGGLRTLRALRSDRSGELDALLTRLGAYTVSARVLYRSMAAGAEDEPTLLTAGRTFREAKALRGHLTSLARSFSTGLQGELHRLARVSTQARYFLLGFMALVLILSAFSVRWVIRRFVTGTVSTVVATLREIEAGGADLSRLLPVSSGDEVGELASSFNGFMGKLRWTVRRLKAVSKELADITGELGRSSRDVAGGAAEQAQSLSSSLQAVQGIQEAVSGIAESSSLLLRAAGESSSATQQMRATNEGIAAEMENLFLRVEEVSGSVDQLSAASQQISAVMEELAATAQDTAGVVNELDGGVVRIRESAEATSRLSQDVARDADAGRRTVETSVAGVTALRELADHSARVIERLGGQAERIGKVLNVIDDVATQTDLLALNATILAAQAGEHGKGFSVVADEIRDLAERTATSTREIAEIIDELQRGARDAVIAMSEGRAQVEVEVERVTEAGACLEKILESASESSGQASEIAQLTRDHAHGSQSIRDAVDQMGAMIAQAASSTAAQRDSAELLARNAKEMSSIASRVKDSTREQVLGNLQVTELLDEIRAMVERIDTATREQSRSASEVLEAVARTRAIAEANARKAGIVDRVVQALTEHSSVLEEEMGAFKT
ncbi:MAG: methyl-accepting chemotaxis protein [Deltaproteobacteria bacterium]|nr:methyl-accepting chemotaxis protein [Deltaproteobacteria bacterium]